MLFTKPPAQKGAAHKIARPEKKVAIFDPLKMDGRADGNQKKASLQQHNGIKSRISFEHAPMSKRS